MPAESRDEGEQRARTVNACLEKCAGILESIIDGGEPASDAVEQWHAKLREGLDPPAAAAAAGIPFDAARFAELVAGQINAWDQTNAGHAAFFLEAALDVWLDPDGSAADRALREMVPALADLARLQFGRLDEDPAGQAAARFCRAATLFLDAGQFPEALLASDAAIVLLGDEPGGAAFAEAAALALKAAEGTGDDDDIRLRKATVAAAAAVGADMTGDHTAIFDAVEAAVRMLPKEPVLRASAVWLLVQATAPDTPFHKLRLYLNFAVGTGRSLAPVEREALRAIAEPVCSLEPDAWQALLEKLLKVFADIENARFAMAPDNEGDTLRTEWETFAFSHAAFAAALPLHDSILRERDLDQLLFGVHHETTHVYSMRSGIGLAVTALRVALLETESRLWSFLDDLDKEARFQRFMTDGPAPLEEHHLLALAQAEQCLALTRKLQILQDVWQPWFEGVAVFAELADDPTMDPAARSDAITVLLNLFDAENPEAQTLEAALQMMVEAERRYSAALGRSAYYGLRSYLLDHPAHYLPGYLAVRSIVAAWRARRQDVLSGSSATRALLFLTRYATWEVVPDLALPVEAFREAATENLRGWLASIAAVPSDDLVAILSAFPGSDGPVFMQWKDGRVEPATGTIGEMSAEMDLRGMNLVRRALRTLTDEHANPERVPDASGECRFVLDTTATGLGHAQHDEPSLARILEGYWRDLNVLVLAEVECPFWLNAVSRQLAVLVRVRRRDVHDGKPRHKMLIQPLNEEQFAALAAEVANLRSARMQVARVADLVSSGHRPSRGHGRHVLVFRFGSWIETFTAGPAWGRDVPADLVDDIAFVLRKSPARRLDREILANGRRGAERTLAWIGRAGEWRFPPYTYAVEEWADVVADMAAEVLLGQQDRGDAAIADDIVLRFVFGASGRADLVREKGLGAFAPDDATLSALVRMLDSTSRSPVPDAPPPGVAAFFVRARQGYDVAPPAAAKQETEG